MVKRNLKHALNVHQAKKVQANKIKAADKAAEEAAKRKAISIKSGKQPKRQKKKSERSIKTYTRPFLKEDTILLVGEGESFKFTKDKSSTEVSLCLQATFPLLTRFLSSPITTIQI
jgi:hypothetical protein